MEDRWFYSREGGVHGSYSVAEMQELVRTGTLHESDLVWREGKADLGAEVASEVFAFAPSGANLPDWLADVVDHPGPEAAGPVIAAPEPTGPAAPPWLEDMRLWLGLEVYAQVKQASPRPAEISISAPGQAAGIPDWLESLRAPEKPKPPPPQVKPPAAPPTPPPQVKPPIVAAPPPQVKPAIVPPALAPAPSDNTVARNPLHRLAEKMRSESGFDPETGQILDQAKFRAWTQQQAKASSATSVSNASLFEVFRKGRLAIEAWVDDDKNRHKVVNETLDALKKDAGIDAIISDHGKYGPEMQDKLLRHLEFMVENRRKYARATKKH